MKRKSVRHRLGWALMCGVVIFPLPADGTEFDGLDSYIEAALKHWQIPGLAMAVVKDGKTVLARGYGVCEIGTDRRVSEDTVFPIASCAKSMSATCIGILVDEEELSWDDPVIKHVPEFELSDPWLTRNVTLRDLLTHRTGLERCDMLCDRGDLEPAEIIRRCKHLPVAAGFRTQMSYSNPMQVVLLEVIRRVSGQSWEEFAAKRIFAPLKMTSTTASAADVAPSRLALRHWRSDAGIVARPDARRDRGIHSTVPDMSEWLKLQLARGSIGDTQLVSPQTIREMHSLQFSVPIRWRPGRSIRAASFYGTGLGWMVQDYRGRKVVSHGGSWGAMVAIMPEENLGVVILSNHDLESLPVLLMYDVFDAFVAGPRVAWNTKKWDEWPNPPGHAYHDRDEMKATLEKTRKTDTRPSKAIKDYTGTYENQLYGTLILSLQGDQLSAKFGNFDPVLAHWQDESFYVRAPTRATFDWLLTFGLDENGDVQDATIKNVGWASGEKKQVFVRRD